MVLFLNLAGRRESGLSYLLFKYLDLAVNEIPPVLSAYRSHLHTYDTAYVACSLGLIVGSFVERGCDGLCASSNSIDTNQTRWIRTWMSTLSDPELYAV